MKKIPKIIQNELNEAEHKSQVNYEETIAKFKDLRDVKTGLDTDKEIMRFITTEQFIALEIAQKLKTLSSFEDKSLLDGLNKKALILKNLHIATQEKISE